MESKQTATRFDAEILRRLAAVLARMAHVGRKATLSDAVRASVAAGLPTLEKAYGIAPPADMSGPMKPAKAEWKVIEHGRRAGHTRKVESK